MDGCATGDGKKGVRSRWGTFCEEGGVIVAVCSGCGKGIVWLKTAAGKNMPVDIETTKREDKEFDTSRHVSHFSTCAEAARFRKAKEKRGSNAT
jgi:hypothetical protein